MRSYQECEKGEGERERGRGGEGERGREGEGERGKGRAGEEMHTLSDSGRQSLLN